MTGRCTLAALSVALCCTIAVSQEKKEPPRREISVGQDSSASRALPKIDLPEFVITGKEAIELPGFAKEPATGNGVYDPAANRRGPGGREPGRVDLGLRKDQADIAPPSNGFNGKVSLGYGSYHSPLFDAWFGQAYGTADFLLRAGYRGSDGFADNTGFRNGFTSLHGGLTLPGESVIGRGEGEVALQGDSYHLYGSATPGRERTVTRFSTDLGLRSGYADRGAFTAGVHLHAASVRDSMESRETLVGLDGSFRTNVGDLEVRTEAGLWSDIYSAPTASPDPYFATIGGFLRGSPVSQLELDGGVMFYLVHGTDGGPVARLYPRLSLSWFVTDHATLFVRFDPSVVRRSLSSLFADNPYLWNDIAIRHTEYPVAIAAGVEADVASGVRGRVALRYERATNLPQFTDMDSLSTAIWSVEYSGTTRIISLEGGLFADLTPRDNLGLTLSFRSTRNTDTDRGVPYLPGGLVGAVYHHRFPFGLTAGSTLQFVGSQFVDRHESRSLPAFAVLSVDLEYEIVSPFHIFLSIDNLLSADQRRFDAYQGRPRVLTAGANYSW